MYTSDKEKIRILANKKLPVTTMKIGNQLFFAEEVRRPTKRGKILIMEDIKLPICKFSNEVNYLYYTEMLINRQEDMHKKMNEFSSLKDLENEKKMEDAAQELKEELQFCMTDRF